MKDKKTPTRTRKEETDKGNNEPSPTKDQVLRPALDGIQKPIPISVEEQNVDEILTQQIRILEEKRAEHRRSVRGDAQKETQKKGTVGPKVISNVQIVPPKSSSGVQAKQADWTKVQSKVEKRRAKKQKQVVQGPAPPETAPPRVTGPVKPVGPKLPRPPRMAAVTIKVTDEKFSYAAALRKARDNISLTDLEIEQSKIRTAANGSILIEVRERKEKADFLQQKLAQVLGDTVIVSRPEIKGDVRLVGLDDSISVQGVADVIAANRGCLPGEVKVEAIRRIGNGLHTVWAQCSLAAAVQAASKCKVKIGWMVARIELLKQRPTQCFKCWATGHLRNQCTSSVDRSNLCFRCGESGHSAVHCVNQLRCLPCVEQGLTATHRVGSVQCGVEMGHPLKRRNQYKGRTLKRGNEERTGTEAGPMQIADD